MPSVQKGFTRNEIQCHLYFTQRHDIPVSAVPCLQYRKGLQKEQEEAAGKEAELDNNDTPNPDQPQPTTNGEAKETGVNGKMSHISSRLWYCARLVIQGSDLTLI